MRRRGRLRETGIQMDMARVAQAGTAVLAETPPSGISALGTGRRRLGESALRVFPLAIGGNVFGFTADYAATTGILNRYSEFGGNFIDTADSYADGRSETMIGDWMRERGNRAEIVVATKVGRARRIRVSRSRRSRGRSTRRCGGCPPTTSIFCICTPTTTAYRSRRLCSP